MHGKSMFCDELSIILLCLKDEGNENVEKLKLDTTAALGKFKGSQVKTGGLGKVYWIRFEEKIKICGI
jgi:hypothetical protein